MKEKNSEKKERKMRDSGIPWIGEVPEGWGMSPLKYNYNIIAGATPDSTKQNFWDGNIKWITPADYKTKDVYVSFGKRNLTSAGYKACSTHMLPKGSIVISKRAPIGSVAITTSDLCTNQGCLGLVAKNKFVNNKYFYYVLSIYDDVLNLYGSGTTFKEISANVFSNIEFPLPSVTIQNSIADFLDSKCSEIDTLIENLRVRMESAKEYKKAIITEAVTKGLDKDAKMKDSGVEWIREVPEGWKTPKLKNVAILTNGDRGKNYPSGNDLVDEGVYFFTSNNLHNQILDCSREKSKFITEARYNILCGAKIRLNDILFCLRGSVGAAAINKTVESGTIASSLVCITPQNIDADFLNYCLQSNINVIQTNLFMNGSCAANLSAENVGNYYIIEPPISEQHHIVNYLDSKCSEIDTLLQNYENQIATIEEYKKSLIYEYVTGKKEVPAA